MPRIWLGLSLLALILPSVAAAEEKALAIGEPAGRLKFTDIRYLPRTLDDFTTKKAFVLVFTNTTCPLARRYLPVLQALEKEYRSKDVQFLALNAAEEDSILDIGTQAVRHDMEFPFVKDFGGACAKALGVRRTPEVVVLNEKRLLCYRGRIDDQYRLSGQRPEPSRRELKDALEAVLAGRAVATPETEVDGCPLATPRPRQPRKATFAEHAAPILQKHCWHCHKPGGGAPFSLVTYKEASARAEAIAEVVREQRMPPWFAAHEFGPFINRRGLSDDERTTLIDWVRSGAAQGDEKHLPPPPAKLKSPWLIGEPDLVLKLSPHELPAAGDIAYKYAILPHVFTADTWVQGVQILADNPRVLHHCNMAFVSLSEGFKESNFITGNVPGGEVMSLDEGVGFLIPKGSMLGLEIHYVATGKPENCTISVGLRYPRALVQKRLRHMMLTDHRFAIPPGAPAHKVSAAQVLDRDTFGVGLFAHMHLRGKDMTFQARLPDGKTDTLLVVPNYSFAWQIPYRWETGKKRLPRGTRIECVAHFDNSPFNPFNPNPKATVRFGLQTQQEMMFGFLFYTDATEQLGMAIDTRTGKVQEKGK